MTVGRILSTHTNKLLAALTGTLAQRGLLLGVTKAIPRSLAITKHPLLTKDYFQKSHSKNFTMSQWSPSSQIITPIFGGG